MMVDTYLLFDTVKETLYLYFAGLIEPVHIILHFRISSLQIFVCKPYLSCPESVSPVRIFRRAIEITYTVSRLELIRKIRKDPEYLFACKIKTCRDSGRSDFLMIIKFCYLIHFHDPYKLFRILQSVSVQGKEKVRQTSSDPSV